jgi:hypothetical protein
MQKQFPATRTRLASAAPLLLACRRLASKWPARSRPQLLKPAPQQAASMKMQKRSLRGQMMFAPLQMASRTIRLLWPG